MATDFCTKCKEQHPGRVCDYKDGDCAETTDKKAGQTVHEAGCPCGFCKAGFTRM